jgi:hypothetical protein
MAFNIGRALEGGLTAGTELLRGQITLQQLREQQQQEALERALRERAFQLQEREAGLRERQVALQEAQAKLAQDLQQRALAEQEEARKNANALVAYLWPHIAKVFPPGTFPENFRPDFASLMAMFDITRPLQDLQKAQADDPTLQAKIDLINKIGVASAGVNPNILKQKLPTTPDGRIDGKALVAYPIESLALLAGELVGLAKQQSGVILEGSPGTQFFSVVPKPEGGYQVTPLAGVPLTPSQEGIRQTTTLSPELIRFAWSQADKDYDRTFFIAPGVPRPEYKDKLPDRVQWVANRRDEYLSNLLSPTYTQGITLPETLGQGTLPQAQSGSPGYSEQIAKLMMEYLRKSGAK